MLSITAASGAAREHAMTADSLDSLMRGGLLPDFAPGTTCHEHRAPIPTPARHQFEDPFNNRLLDIPVILCLARCQTGHLPVEPDPSVLRMSSLHFPRLQQCAGELDLENVITSAG